MKKTVYSRLAWHGIRKNSRLYFPYLFTCIGMVMMYYIVCFLRCSSFLDSMPGGGAVGSMLDMGRGIIMAFSLIFLFYTNSFLVKGRKKEFGLYNILGMGKTKLGRILVWEALIMAVISLVCGLAAGVLFSKLAELAVSNLAGGTADFSLAVNMGEMLRTIRVFGVIFALLLLNMLRQIHLSKPIELLRGENVGEKPPRANWILAAAGILLLAAAYYIAVTIEDPVATLAMFFIAVLLVILGTYLLFIAGSVAICRILQKKKKYYYKTNHFISVSSMTYRMKRNGAGLASICILCTMVLVMISATTCLYVGSEDTLRRRYPRNIVVNTEVKDFRMLESEKANQVSELADQTVRENGQEMENVLDYRIVRFGAFLKGDQFQANIGENVSPIQLGGVPSSYWEVRVVSLEDYNRVMGQQETLEDNEVLIFTAKASYDRDTVQIQGTQSMRVKGEADDFIREGDEATAIYPAIYLFVPDFQSFVTALAEEASGLQSTSSEEGWKVQFGWNYGFDLECDDETQILISRQLNEALESVSSQAEDSYFDISCDGVAGNRDDFYGLFGGLFFLGIVLGIVFLFAMVLIIYYKQISEGFEDQSRFEIMQKVGMTDREIRKNINSQILTVFFLPLLLAAVHLAFSFPMVSKLLLLFGMTNQRLMILVTVISLLIFAVFYMAVYRMTSGAYYTIVKGARRN